MLVPSDGRVKRAVLVDLLRNHPSQLKGISQSFILRSLWGHIMQGIGQISFFYAYQTKTTALLIEIP